jgi:hypothetical protein
MNITTINEIICNKSRVDVLQEGSCLCVFQFFLMIYMLFGFSEKKAGINLYYALSIINVSLFMGCACLILIFDRGNHTIDDDIIVICFVAM